MHLLNPNSKIFLDFEALGYILGIKIIIPCFVPSQNQIQNLKDKFKIIFCLVKWKKLVKHCVTAEGK